MKIRSKDIVLETFKKIKLSTLVRVPIVVVYKNPKDYPDKYVARLWDIKNKATLCVIVRDTLEQIRDAIPDNLTRISPTAKDDPVIVETWL